MAANSTRREAGSSAQGEHPVESTLSATTSRDENGVADALLDDEYVRSYLLRPTSRTARLVCLVVWAAAAAGLGALAWWLVPIFLRKVVVPVQNKVKRDWSPLAVAACVIAGVACAPTLLLPAGPFIWLAAVVLGVWRGYLAVQAGTALGMSASYLLGRRFLRQRIRSWVENKDWAQALFMAVKEAGPFKVVLLMRLGPAPYAWLSYACSLSPDIRYLPYITASIIGRSPHNLIDIYLGTGIGTAGDAAMGKKLDAWHIVLYAIGFVMAVATAGLGYAYASRALKDLRARALARSDVLSAFTVPELEDLGVPEGPDLRLDGLAKARHGSGRREDLELIGVGVESDAAGLDHAPSASPRMLREEGPLLPRMASQTRQMAAGSKGSTGMRLPAPSKQAHHGERARLLDEQTRNDEP